jgi:hypothetical protein
MVSAQHVRAVMAANNWSSDTSFAEKHYRVSDLAELWGLGRKLIMDDPGVIKIRQGRKKMHTTYSVPESAARRIHTRLLNLQ